MLKRTTGQLLLTLLVITGLAGTVNDSSLSSKERKQAISLMKQSRTEVLSLVSGLSAEQFDYKPDATRPSIKELLVMMVNLEKKCSDEIRQTMNRAPNPELRLKIALTDDQLLAQNSYGICKASLDQASASQAKDPYEALHRFVALRNQHIKYIRTSTQDLRNHVLSTPAGWIDCYQYYLLLADRSSYIAQQITQLRSLPSFPRQ
jgi:hypothetical protein